MTDLLGGAAAARGSRLPRRERCLEQLGMTPAVAEVDAVGAARIGAAP